MSSTTPTADTRHPVLGFAVALEAALDRVSSCEPVFMSPEDKAEALVTLRRGQDRLHALVLRLLVASPEVAELSAARDTVSWLAQATRTERGPNAADARLGEALDRRWHHLAAAFAGGEVNTAQARVIVRCLDALPTSGEFALEAATVVAAEKHLVDLAHHHTPAELAKLGEHVLDVVAPEIADQAVAKALADEERTARERTSLRFKPLGGGATRVTATVPDAVARRLGTYLDAYTSPRHTRDGAAAEEPGTSYGQLGEGDRIPAARKRGHAFAALLEGIDPHRLPVHGGDATTLVITMDLDKLVNGLGAAAVIGAGSSAGSGSLSPGEVRRLACTAHLVPAVLGSKSEVLDLGRAQRLFSRAQRKAMVLRDRRCRAEGCTMPATFCEAHHVTPWSTGGRTDLADGVLLCSWHHHRAHETQTYRTNRLPTGDLRFTRRT
jgi:hypothetical protein